MAQTQTVIQLMLTPEELQELIVKAIREGLGKAPQLEYVGVREIMQEYGISRATLSNWTGKRGCPYIANGRVLRFKLADVDAWYRGREKRHLTQVK